MERPSDELIYDRTQADVTRVKGLTQKLIQGTATAGETAEWLGRRMKGAWNNTDLNRIETWTAYLAQVLRQQGYDAPIKTGKVWQEQDIPFRADVDRIRGNVETLQAGFYALPDWREIAYNNTVDLIQANALEWDLHCIEVWLGRMVAAFLYAGEIYAGEVW